MNWPQKYADGIQCQWNIKAPLGYVIVAEVADFWLAGNVKQVCSETHLTLTDSDNLEMEKLCGRIKANSLKSSVYRTNGRSLRVNFEAGILAAKRGFRLKLRAVPEDSDKSVRTNQSASSEQKSDSLGKTQCLTL